MTMDIYDLKRQWDTLEVPDTDILAMEREVSTGSGITTLRDRLMRISRRRAVVCFVGALCLAPPLVPEYLVMAVMIGVFFMVMGVMHIVQLRCLRRLDLADVTVSEVMRRVLRIETFRVRRHIVGVVMAVPLTVYIIFTVTRDYGAVMLPACAVGLLAGCVVALFINTRATRLLNEIKRELGEDFSAH